MQIMSNVSHAFSNALITAIPIGLSLITVVNAYKASVWRIPESWEASQIDLGDSAKKLAKEAGINREIRYFARDLEGAAAVAYGNHSILNSDISVVVDRESFLATNSLINISNAWNFILRHEYAHIKNNDLFFHSMVTATVSVASLVFGLSYLTPFYTSLLIIATARTAGVLYSRFMEGRADDMAIKNSSPEELKAWLFLLKQNAERGVLIHKQGFAGVFRFSPEGNDNQDIEHPSLMSRMKKVESALELLESQEQANKLSVINSVG